jgi:splicing suppressor protein 51
MLTIIAGLEAVCDDLATKETVNLHLIGATSKELESLVCFEELLHLLPHLKKLHCSFVGPELPRMVDGNNTVTLDCCPLCTSESDYPRVLESCDVGLIRSLLDAKRVRSMQMFTGTYHDYVKTEHYGQPDLAVAFHTGHSLEEQVSWAPTIKHLAACDYSTVFTTYNEAEMLGEMGGLKELGAKFLVDGQKNKWKGMRPMLDPLEEEENIPYYHNYFWYMIAGHGAKK